MHRSKIGASLDDRIGGVEQRVSRPIELGESFDYVPLEEASLMVS
jgi:hypothetical protein